MTGGTWIQTVLDPFSHFRDLGCPIRLDSSSWACHDAKSLRTLLTVTPKHVVLRASESLTTHAGKEGHRSKEGHRRQPGNKSAAAAGSSSSRPAGMAPNKRGGPLSQSVVSADEVAARGSGTAEQEDSYDRSLSAEARVAATGLIFLTRLPSPIRSADHHPAYLMRSMAYFPVLGCLIGVWAAVFYAAAVVLLPPTVASGVSTLATVWLTGCFHEDGLADCFDGFGGGWGRAQILRIMKDSRIGTYALVGMLLVLHQKLHALAAFDAATAAAALIAAHTASRWSSVPLLYFCTYIQDEDDAKKGLYNWFADSQRLLTLPRLLFATASAVLIPVAVLGVAQALICCSAVLVVTICAGLYGKAIIGGVVGDFLGATIQVAELCCYLALLADWSVLVDGSGAWRPVLLLAFTATLPVIYCRRIIDFGPVC